MFQTILPHYPYVKPIVKRYEELYREDFPMIKNWDYFGKLVLLELLASRPCYLDDPIRLQLTYRVTFVSYLGALLRDRSSLLV